MKCNIKHVYILQAVGDTCVCQSYFFFGSIGNLSCSGRESFLALSTAALSTAGPSAHHGESLDPALGVRSRANWQLTTGSFSAESEPRETLKKNSHFRRFFARTSHAVNKHSPSGFPRSCSDGHYYKCVDTAYACVLCVCATRACAGLCPFARWSPTFRSHLFPRTILRSSTRRRTPSCHTAVHQVQSTALLGVNRDVWWWRCSPSSTSSKPHPVGGKLV